MQWKIKEGPPPRDEQKWYPHFPIFLPVQIDKSWFWFTWVEERYTGFLTGQDGEKIYEWRERQADTPPNGPVHAITTPNWFVFAIIGIFIFIAVWNHYHC
jgi:hypothetical protein